jgi:hypothetical protein
VEFSQQDQVILSDLGKAKRIYPDLIELLDFYEKLYLTQFAFKSRLRAAGEAGCCFKKEVDPKGLTDGYPQVAFEELGIQATPFLDLYRDIGRIVIPYVGFTEGHSTEPSPDRIVGWAQEIFLGRGPLVTSGETGARDRTIAGFTLAPYLQLASERVLPRIPLNMWYREYCPICGGRPVIGALTSDTGPRTLFCPRCHGEWSFGRVGCPFCKSSEAQTYYTGKDSKYRLYVCEACNRYLKTVDFREKGPQLCLTVECLVTVSMDIAARERGFST